MASSGEACDSALDAVAASEEVAAPGRPLGLPDDLPMLLDSCRRYLRAIADQQLGRDLQAKLGASDLVQDTFLAAQRDWRNFTGDSPEQLRAWLRQILLCRVADAQRAFRQAQKRSVQHERSLSDVEQGRQSSPICATDASPSQQAILREDTDRLEAALTRLSPEALEVVLWRNRERLSFVEIGRRLQLSPDAARKTWSRAIVQLSRLLASES